MAGVEVLAGLGLAATELFRYNRQNYEFDQDQRFEKEELRLKMQVERFSLFREDVRDLVELTVSKMDLYHMVGALFLKACIVYYCEGYWTEAPPVFLLALYYLSNACAVVYFVLGVWLAMHASISSHSYGTKLLTRFIRLPIPGSDEMNTLNARFADFERQDFQQMLRVPFVGQGRKDGKAEANEWQQREQLDGSPSQKRDFLARPEKALPTDNDEELLQAVEMRTQRHVNLFRKLQAKWQCYDAYARVCMSLGCRQLVQAITYFLVGETMVENKNYATIFALVLALQAVGASITTLDISSWPCWKNLDLTLLGWGPGFFAAIAMVLRDDVLHDGIEDPTRILHRRIAQVLALASYVFEIIWFELLLSAATPTDDLAALPRCFRTVMFMDVFSEADDPTTVDVRTGKRKLTTQERDAAEDALVNVASALMMAHSALRRWQALPGEVLSEEQIKQRTIARRRLKMNIKDLQKDLKDYGLTALSPELVHIRAWEHMTVEERDEDPYADSLLGPLRNQDKRNSSEFYLHLEDGEYVNSADGRRVLTLIDLIEKVKDFEHEVSLLCEAAGDRGKSTRHEVGADTSEEEEATPLTAARRSDTRLLAASKTVDIERYEDGSEKVKAQPERLPWILVRFMTRATQLVWIAVFIVATIQDYDPNFVVDTVDVSIVEDRRLAALAAGPEAFGFEALEVSWPMGAFFRPESLACPPAQAAAAAPLLVASPFALYAGGLGAGAAALEELGGGGFTPGTAIICGPPQPGAAASAPPEGCLLAAPLPGRVALWPWAGGAGGPEAAGAAALGLEGPEWRVLAGAAVACEDAGLPQRGPAEAAPWCLLLAGWSGGEALSVAAVPLADGPSSPPRASAAAAWRPHLELPLAPAAGEAPPGAAHPAVAALHLEPAAGRLWALLEGGELRAWSLLRGPPRPLGRWPVPTAVDGRSFQAAAVCEAPEGRGLLVAGRTAGAGGGPALLRAPELPLGL